MIERRCGICTRRIGHTAQLVFIGETNALFSREPPLHKHCAAYALQVCPVLHASGERIEVALTRSYEVAEERITGVASDGTFRRAVYPLHDPAARLLAVLEFYLAFPDTPERLTGPKWLAECAPKLLP
ncbi:hypothetical protein ACFWGI_35650 [Streptomyces niveus]|uniref:hypothetical protein n=1 Tax=Streptomyces niveus TaxID=193462 RepID=UPI0036687ECB